MAKTKRKKLDPTKCERVLYAIQDILYLTADGYHGSKEWDVEMLDRIAMALEVALPRPPDLTYCDECGAAIPQTSGSIANRHHAKHCSLYNAKEE